MCGLSDQGASLWSPQYGYAMCMWIKYIVTFCIAGKKEFCAENCSMNQRPYENTAIKCIAQQCTSKSKSKEQGTPKTKSETKTEQHSISASEPVVSQHGVKLIVQYQSCMHITSCTHAQHCAKATGLNIARSNQQRPCSVKSSDRSRSFAQQQLHQDSGTTITGKLELKNVG